MNYKSALKAGYKVGAANAEGDAELALACQGIQLLAGAVSEELVYEGARKRGLTGNQLLKMATEHPLEVEKLMWE